MKKILFLMMSLVMTLGFVACSEDENGEKGGGDKTITTADIEGVYGGNMNIEIKLGEAPAVPVENTSDITITANGNDKIDLSLKNFSIEMLGSALYVGNIELTNVPVTAGADNATFTTEQGIQITAGDMELPAGSEWIGPGLSLAAGEAGIPVKANGEYKNNTLKLTIDIPFDAIQTNVKVDFSGTKK